MEFFTLEMSEMTAARDYFYYRERALAAQAEGDCRAYAKYLGKAGKWLHDAAENGVMTEAQINVSARYF